MFAPQGPDYDLANNAYMKLLSTKFNIQFTFQTTTWDAYVKGLDGLGLPRYLQIQQEAYDKSSYKK